MGPNVLIGLVLIGILILVLLPWEEIKSRKKQRSGDETVPIYKPDNLVEAQVIKGLLEENGISCLMSSFEDYAYDGIWQRQKGWGVLRVLESNRAKAEELIASFLKTEKKAGTPGFK